MTRWAYTTSAGWKRKMEFVDKLLQETDYLEQLKKLELLEQNRKFCRHGLSHLLDTARIAWIRCQELSAKSEEAGYSGVCGEQVNVQLERETVYLAALLHDLGRIREYEAGIPHHEAGAVVAKRLLEEIGYSREKAELIITAVAGHRSNGHGQEIVLPDDECGQETELSGDKCVQETRQSACEEQLRDLLKWADKQSRNCFCCEAQQECNWPDEKRNWTIVY